tara:strand:- start:25 stop:513 length:489 start_codon:yes stop_codon:yes gene_type:complete
MSLSDTWLDTEDYKKMVKAMPIVSVDLIINDDHGRILLGKRKNRPAANHWFVPGGRLFKGETIPDAVKRISYNELGTELVHRRGLGVFHQMYPDNFSGNTYGSHYITFAMSATANNCISLNAGDDQHEELRWWKIRDLMEAEDVHSVTKNYFHPTPKNRAFL